MIFPFRGLMAPVLTPFSNNSDQSIFLDGIPAYAKYLLEEQKVLGVLVNGTSGEGMSMTVEERMAVTEAWVDACKTTKQTVMVQVGGACLKDVQLMAAHAEKLGAAGLLCLPDLFNKPATIEDLADYLGHVGSAAPDTPLLYYHMPAYTAVNLDMSKMFELAVEKVPTFAGAKFTHTNMDEGTRCQEVATANKLSLFLGCDTIMAGAYALGFDSAIATTLNMYAEPSHKILQAVKYSKTADALEQQRKLTSVINVITRNGGWVATMKAAMNLMTPMKMGPPRPPLRPLEEEHVTQMRKELAECKLVDRK